MNIPYSVALELQYCVGSMALDCFNPFYYLNAFNGVLGCGVGYDRVSWQMTVDVIHRLVKSKMVYYPWAQDGGEEYDRLIEALRIFDDKWATRAEWFDDLCPTNLCLDLIERHDLTNGMGFDGYRLSGSFVDEIEGVFEKSGVPWSDKPLVPIVVP